MTESPSATSTRPISPYERRTAEVHEWDPRSAEVAGRIAELVRRRLPDLVIEHIGSTAVRGLPGKGIIDLSVEVEPAEIPGIVETLYDLGFQPQPGPDPWPPTRPMLVGSVQHEGTEFRIHFHVQPTGGDFGRDIAFRNALRDEPELFGQYRDLKVGITHGGAVDGFRYTHSKTAWILGVYRRLGFSAPAIVPPAFIGIIGGGQLGRMVAIAARQLGYRIAILDPDPECPAAPVADRVELGRYDDIEAARRMADGCAVVTYELEHVPSEIVAALDNGHLPIRPGVYALKMSQDRLAERRFVEANGGVVAPWREVSSAEDIRVAAGELGYPVRLKAATGGYDGRGQVRLESDADIDAVLAAPPPTLGFGDRPMLLERELPFEAELSVVVGRAVDGVTSAFPIARNVHDRGILVRSVVPAGVSEAVEAAAAELAASLATGMGLVGILTVELFLMPDGSLIVNELAPRVHNSGHWSIEAAATSQFEQHVRAICGLPLGPTALRVPAAATVNLLGSGVPRAAVLAGMPEALAVADAHLHLYDKRTVFERRKMGHVTALGEDAEAALARADRAAGNLHWTGGSNGV
ncbi:MAG TPA: 5-(carboxyamino)imidazole ribonucleotide synthase [Candidatus Eisenbacteria bacterium]|nr:5-(carboxyamino)imidazole ribonucleotide synthase [Candidatus Eisenbacteria bacterium]